MVQYQPPCSRLDPFITGKKKEWVKQRGPVGGGRREETSAKMFDNKTTNYREEWG